ncbi:MULTISPECIES: hypothetical protein [Rhizobium]|uniref:Uncharacterized protein n=1 Tax=Rhizobium esperanzae TaxID=1967781 RepID=A0A7W6ULY3_9HYPH|nr:MULTISPECIES: hypothetical protein [Rhizobium]MBB4439726.1 hypothetical protein [Rhizobium esperanzae]MDH6202066.1 hypothetical protein [Rhizobium leguminosarum]
MADPDHDPRGWDSDPLGRFQKSLGRRLLSPFDARAAAGKLVKRANRAIPAKLRARPLSLLVEATYRQPPITARSNLWPDIGMPWQTMVVVGRLSDSRRLQ